MPRLQLRISIDPGKAETFARIKRKDGGYHFVVATIDTGAEVSLLPAKLLNFIDYRLAGHGTITVDQAGIARQSFVATEAIVTLLLEDEFGVETNEFEARGWFADTGVALIGFADILDRATLHIDMWQTRNAWIEIDP